MKINKERSRKSFRSSVVHFASVTRQLFIVQDLEVGSRYQIEMKSKTFFAIKNKTFCAYKKLEVK